MVASDRFWNKRAARYAKEPVKDEAAYARTLERVAAHLTPTDAVLELACGTGTTAIKIAPTVAAYDATDIASAMIAIAEEKAKAAGSANLRLAVAEPTSAPTRDGGYDVVMAFHLLHLVPDMDGALAAIRDRLRPGGLFISKTVCIGDGPSIWRFVVPPMRLMGKAPYVAFLKVADLDRRIADAGFEILETGNYPAKPPSRFVVARRR